MIIILFLIIHLLISLNELENALTKFDFNDLTDITCVTYHVNVKMCQQN